MSYVVSRQAEILDAEKAYFHSVQGFGEDVGALASMVKSPLMQAGFAGLSAWIVARSVGTQPDKASRIGFVTGGFSLVTALLAGYLRKELAKAQAAQPAVAQTAPQDQQVP